MVTFAGFSAHRRQKIFFNCHFCMLLYNLQYETQNQRNYIRAMPCCPDGVADWQQMEIDDYAQFADASVAI